MPSMPKQFVKYLMVGGLANGSAYGLYLGFVFMGAGPYLSMTIVYLGASIFAFTMNRKWTFASNLSMRKATARYIVIQGVGYITNLILLVALHQALGIPHYLAQLTGIVLVAIELFLLSRYYVFI